MSGVAATGGFHIGHCNVVLSVTVENCYAIEHIHISSIQSKSFRQTDLRVFYIRFDVAADAADDDGDYFELIQQENLIFLHYF
ncbi:unnamed protein product [Rotaria sordida]|uniref:Uncharacterized protein n=1 Tax=Rotaria sordida TaxID=392033 RepID=A0A819FLG4_9BILA|nr:unnamed protein product [Rotaria sordida]